MFEGVLEHIGCKRREIAQQRDEPQSYAEMAAKAPSIEELLLRRGVDVERCLAEFSDYVERVEHAGAAAVVHAGDVPLTGNVHISMGRTITRRQADKLLRK